MSAEEPNGTCLPLTQPQPDSPSTGPTSDLLTFECHSASLHCFPSPRVNLNKAKKAIIKRSRTSEKTVTYARISV